MMSDQEYYVYPILEGTDWREHTEDHRFCDDPSCPCHEDEENQETLQQWYDEGLIGASDGDLISRGHTI
jgi:hypothetical protein